MITAMLTPIMCKKNRIVLLCSLLLAGCQLLPQSEKKTVVTPPTVAVAPATTALATNRAELARSQKDEGDRVRLQQCQGQLDALKTMNPAQFKRMRSAFDYLMNGAAQYADLRSKTNADTQDTVDSLYRYRANLLCAQIAQTLLDSLTNRGEARP